MTAQEWLDELERLRKAATPGPWDVSQKNSTVYDNYGDSVCDTQQTHNSQNNLAYIVAACNAVPRLMAMIKYLSEEASGEAGGPGEWFMRTSEEVLQDAYQATEPKE